MDLVDLDLCVVLPVSALDAWVRTDLSTRATFLSNPAIASTLELAGVRGLVFRRVRPYPTKALHVLEPRKRVAIAVSGADTAIRSPIDEPEAIELLGERVKVPSALIVMGGDLAHADVAGGTPVAGPHRMIDLAPGDYRIERRTTGAPGDATFATAIVYQSLT
jgi:hypothetical protein